MTPPLLIEALDLTKHFGTLVAVDGVTLHARQGEVVGLLGPNGAGKTTLMRMLTGFTPPTSGSARIAGHDIAEDTLAARRAIGYLPEGVPTYPDMTAREFVLFWARLRGVPGRQARQRADAVLEAVQLVEARHTLVRQFSKGMRQRLGLAQALVHEPPVLILDEPTIGIDPYQVIEVRQMVRALGATRAVLFSTHILTEAEQVCDRVLILNAGRLVAEGTPAELRARFQQRGQWRVSAEGDAGRVRAILEAVPGVDGVAHHSDGGFTIAANADVRAAISTALAGAGLPLLELRAQPVTLEDIFLGAVQATQHPGGQP